MKRILFALFAVIVATALLTVFVTCDSAFIAIGQGKKLPDISKLKKKTSSSWGEEFWGEWLRVDEPEVWYIAGDGITIDDVASSKNISMTKQSARIIEVREGGADYLLYASRIPNSTFRGTLRRLADDSSSSGLRASFGTEIGGPALALGSGLGGIKITVRNLKNAADKKEAETGADGGFEVPNATPGDEYEVAPQVEDGPTVKVTPVAEDEDIGNITVTGGVNFKAAIRAGTGTDMTTLYADGRDYNIILEIENVGKLDSAGATAVFTADSGLTLSQANAALGTIASGEKQTVALTVSASAINENEVTRKIDVAVSDNASGKTIEDFVTLHFFKGRTNFNIKSNATVQGVVMSPHGKSASFKTESVGNYAASVSLPWSDWENTNDDYLISVTGAVDAAYSIGISSMPETNFEGVTDIYEPNNTESAASVIDAGLAPAKITALLPSGDIDYYKIQNAAQAPELALVDVGVREVEGESNGDGIFSAGEQTYLDVKLRNNSGMAKVATLILSVDAAYSSYITISPASRSSGSIDAGNYKTITDSENAAISGTQLLKPGNESGAFTITASSTCPVNTAIPFTVTINDGISRTESLLIFAGEGVRGLYKQNGDELEKITGMTAPILANTLNWLKTNAETGAAYTILLDEDEPIAPQTLNQTNLNGKTGVKITLKGFKENRTVQLASTGSLFRIEDSVAFVLDEHITLKGINNNTNSLVRTIGGTFIMNGGEISGNTWIETSNGYGGGVYIENGAFTMNSGKIINNTIGLRGGGVYGRNNSIFTMNGGEISGNTAAATNSGFGGGVYIELGAFTMNSGEISDNISSHIGGGVAFSGCTFTMHNGKITNNTSAGYGGGVWNSDGIFTINGGEITNNKVTQNDRYGGGVYLNYGEFNMNNGTISGNTAASGSGIGAVYSDTVIINGGEISGNTGIGVIIEVSALTMNGGKILGNIGGGVNVSSNSSFTMSGGEISGNSSSNYGGGVYMGAGCTFKKVPAPGSSTSGIIYGYTVGDPKSNVVKNSGGAIVPSKGHAVYVSGTKKRETTVTATQSLDSTQDGAAGGWTE